MDDDIHTYLNEDIKQNILFNNDFNFQEFVDFLLANVGEYYFINEDDDPDDIIDEIAGAHNLNNLNNLDLRQRITLLGDLRDTIQALDVNADDDVADLFLNQDLIDEMNSIFPLSPPATPPPVGNVFEGINMEDFNMEGEGDKVPDIDDELDSLRRTPEPGVAVPVPEMQTQMIPMPAGVNPEMLQLQQGDDGDDEDEEEEEEEEEEPRRSTATRSLDFSGGGRIYTTFTPYRLFH